MAARKPVPKRKLVRVARLFLAICILAIATVYLVGRVFEEYSISSPTWQTRQVIKSDPCLSICSRSNINGLADNQVPLDTTEARAYFINANGDNRIIAPGQCACIEIVIPGTSGHSGKENGYKPLPLWPEDAIMVDIVQVASPLSLSLSANNTVEDPLYRNARVTVSVDTLHPQGKISNGFSNARVYRGAAQLFDPGLYTIDARLEARGAQWNAEPGQMTPAYEETQIQFAGNHLGVRRDTRHPTYIARHQRLPLCTQGDAPGRWIPKENLPGHWQSWQHLYPAEDGRVWMPYHCRLRLISHAEFTFHMSYMYPSVHWYGDSNSRRTLRPIVSAGKWCYRKDEQSRLDCLCNDAPKDLFPDEWYKQMPVPHWYRVHTSGVLGEEIYADLRNRTRAPTDPRAIVAKDPSDLRYSPDYVPPGYRLRDDYFDLYYLFTRGTQDMYGSYWQRDITENGIKTYPRARLVVFQMITWDVAFGSFADFVEQTALLVRRLKAVYPGAQFVYRSGPYWCCRAAEDQGKKYSRMRFLAFDRHARGVFKKHLDAWIWDVMGPAASRCPESKRMEDNMPCRSAHSRSEVIHIDNQMLMNMVVNNIRDE